MLIIFGGLPGTGKTTIAKQLAKKLKAAYLRVDTVEQTLISTSKVYNPEYQFIGPEGYEILYAIAQENLFTGINVIVDTVNPEKVTRETWQKVAKSADSPFIEIELICSDKEQHKSRVTSRVPDIQGHKLPTWQEIVDREYEPWESRTLLIDTSKYSVEESLQMILDHLNF
ncbi:TPA: AAA family ATPase [Legionella pneumophila]